jgi:predicted nucleic acid-binding protein
VAAGRAEICIDEEGIAELARVLGYELRKVVLTAESQAACLMECSRVATKQDRPATGSTKIPLPVCSDADDQKFLELAQACGAAFLVTRDRALLELSRHRTRPVPFGIVEPGKLGSAVGI